MRLATALLAKGLVVSSSDLEGGKTFTARITLAAGGQLSGALTPVTTIDTFAQAGNARIVIERVPGPDGKERVWRGLREAARRLRKGGRIGGGILYATALFERATVERHLAYLRRVLEAC